MTPFVNSWRLYIRKNNQRGRKLRNWDELLPIITQRSLQFRSRRGCFGAGRNRIYVFLPLKKEGNQSSSSASQIKFYLNWNPLRFRNYWPARPKFRRSRRKSTQTRRRMLWDRSSIDWWGSVSRLLIGWKRQRWGNRWRRLLINWPQ